MERTEHPSLLSQVFDMHTGSWKSQLFVYGFTFIIALAVALIADLGLGQSETSVALFSVSLVAVLSFLVPVISVKLFDNKVDVADVQEPYAKLRQDMSTLQEQFAELNNRLEMTSHPYKIDLSAAALADLEMLVSDTKSASVIHYIQNLVYKELTNLRLESIYVADEDSSSHNLMLPVDLKSLLEQLAKVYGFTSVEEYLLNVINVQLRKIQEREAEESREAEKRRKFIATDKLFVSPNIPRPSIEPEIRRNESNFVERSRENKSKLEEGDHQQLVEQHPSGSPAEL